MDLNISHTIQDLVNGRIHSHRAERAHCSASTIIIIILMMIIIPYPVRLEEEVEEEQRRHTEHGPQQRGLGGGLEVAQWVGSGVHPAVQGRVILECKTHTNKQE